MAEFQELLRSYRERAGISQRALSRASAINPAIISRLESGDRGPSGPPQVEAIARALRLGPDDADALLASAGYWPASFLALGAGDPTLLAVARLLSTQRVDAAARDRFRRLVALLVEQWTGGGA